MRKSVRFSTRIPLSLLGIDQVHFFRSARPKNIVIQDEAALRRERATTEREK
jgi:hypothetical protein